MALALAWLAQAAGASSAANPVEFGHYISIAKTVPVILVLLLWTRLLTWIDKDAPAAHLPRIGINLGLTGGLIAAFFLFFVLPNFAIAFSVLMLAMAGEISAYLLMRHQQVGLTDLKKQFRDWLASFSKQQKQDIVVAGQVQIVAKGGNVLPPPAQDTPQRPGYDAVQSVLAEPLRKGAERLEMVQGQEASAAAEVRYYVDGFAYTGPTVDRAASSAAITYLKAAAALNLQEHRKPQIGTFRANLDDRRCEIQLQTAGSATGEYMRLVMDPKRRCDFRLDQLGLLPDQVQAIQQGVQSGRGIVLVAAPRGQGLTSTLYAIIRVHDAFTTHIHTIERVPELDLEGITQNKLPPNASPAEEYKLVSWVASQEPDALLMAQMEDPRSAVELAKFAATGKRVYVGLRAGNTLEALALWRKMIADDRVALRDLELVLAGRVLRRLCTACKVGYAPDPEALRKLNMDPQRVGQLFMARSQPLRDKRGHPVPCTFCHDLHFRGRLGIFETFRIDDETRQTALAGGTPTQLKAAFRKQRGLFLQEVALLRVEQGETSLQEVQRVMKATEQPAAAAAR